MSKHDSLIIRLRVVCRNPPDSERDAAVFGLQNKNEGLIQGKRWMDETLAFECEVNVEPGAAGKPPNFLGQHVHGTPTDRFLYLSYRPAVGGPWIRRLKVPLSSIPWEQVAAASATRKTLEATVDGSRAARVPLIGGGWELR